MANTIKIGGIEISAFKVGNANCRIYLADTLLYPHVQEPCFAVVDDITQYSDRTYVDVFNEADGLWYKLNNLNQYEQYGIYGSGRTITTYDGKLTVDEATIPSPSRLPSGYTEVEYIRNSNYNSYINTGVIPYDNTSNRFTVTARVSSEYHSNLACATIIACEEVNSPYYGFGYRYKCSAQQDVLEFFGADGTVSKTSASTSGDTVTLTFDKTANSTKTMNVPLYIFGACGNASYTSATRYSDSALYSMTVVKNNETVRDFVPAKRDSDDKYGLYDLITDTFYTSPNGNNFSGGSEVTPTPTTATCEFLYSGNSWNNVGEVSGSTIQTVWYDPASTNASFSIGHYWGTGYKMVFNIYLSGSYGSNSTSFWTHNNQEPIEFIFYNNGFFYDMHNPTSTSSPDVYTGDYNYRIMRNNTLSNYQNGQILNVILTYGTVRVELEETGTAIVTGSTSVASQSWYNGLYLPKIENGNSNNKCHLSRIQVYNASNELVNDLKFVKNNGVTGSQEISMYDSVLNVTYNNTNSNTPTYHIVEEGVGVEYPLYYVVREDPPNNLTFSSMTEAEAYECPWVGMSADIDNTDYMFCEGNEWLTKYTYIEVSGDYLCDNGNKYKKMQEYDRIPDGTTTATTVYVKGDLIESASTDCSTDYSTQYLTLVAQTDSVSFKYDTATSSNKLQYSLDSGSTWNDLGNNQSTTSINSGDKIMFKASGLTVNGERGIGHITPSASATVEGNIMSLAYGDNFSGQTVVPNNFQFRKLFSGDTTITSAENMVLPATTIKKQCYSQMFQGCTSLTTAPAVIGSSAMTWTNGNDGYYWSDMFNSCTSLINPPQLPALNLGAQCYWYMFQNCTSLTTAPELPATTTANQCYNGMFSGCASLNYIKVLASSGFSMSEWVKNVASSGTFVKNSTATFGSCGQNTVPCNWTIQNA